MWIRCSLVALVVVGVFAAPPVLIAEDASSNNYTLEWHTKEGSGGGSTSSSNFSAELTIGQTVVGSTDGTAFDADLGFWVGYDAPIFSDDFEIGTYGNWSVAMP